MRELLFALVLLAAATAITVGVAQIYPPAAWIIAGLQGAGLGWLVLGDVE